MELATAGMNFTKVLRLLLAGLGLLILACQSDQTQQSGLDSEYNIVDYSQPGLYWKHLNGRLYLCENGDIGFASAPELVNIPPEQIEGERVMCLNHFITTLGDMDGPSLKEELDAESFESLGADFYKDKNGIYSYYPMCDGGYLNLFRLDTSGFRRLNGYYVVYKDSVFMFKGGYVEADVTTFHCSTTHAMIARDSGRYYQFGEPFSKEEIRSDMGSFFDELNFK